ncbi:hypothetical protein [Rhizobium leguminosarum]|uniref:hypothetical protein n=1 Tax=Rhizobium leguminosarum TaxID=384 RepID=UPI0013EF1704|nr:hypothetical protein [Rhizobium leguminosarum]
MPLTARQVYRDYITDGIPSSGNHKPAKADVRTLLTGYEAVITAFTSNGGLVYTSRAVLFADLAHAPNSSAWVIGDATAAYNGVYMKAGASGSGSWTRVADLPYSFVQLTDAGAGTANAIQLTSTIPTSQSVLRVANVFEANAGNVTVSENGGPAKSLLTSSGGQIAAAGLTAGMMIVYVDDGAAFRLLSDQASAAIQAAAAASASAAAGSASAASASAAAAAASAAGVSLPAVAANRMLVDNAAGTTRESKTLSETMTILAGAVSGRTSTFSLDNSTLYKARSLKDRWLDSYRLNEELNFTGGGATATDAAVLQALFNRAKAAGRGEIILPRGDIALEATCLLKNPGATPNKIRVVGQGAGATRFLNTSAAQVMFWLGDDADADYTRGIACEGFSLAAAVAQNDSGSGFFLRHTSDLSFKDIFTDGLRNGWSFGVGGPAVNNSVYSHLSNCGGNSPGTSGVALIRLGSGGILTIDGGAHRWNANGGHIFMEHDNTSWNWDGLYVYDQFFEHFQKYLASTGKGIVNAEWTGGQVDRADIFFQIEASVPASGSNRDWNIHDVKLLGFSGQGGAIGVLASGTVESVRIAHNTFHGLHDACIYASTGGVFIEGNEMVQCADLGASAPLGGALIRLGQGRSRVLGNFGYRPGGAPGSAYRYGIQWDGATYSERSAANNVWYNFGASAETGTM